MKMDQKEYGYRLKMDQKEYGYNTGWKWIKNNIFTGENKWKEYGCRIKMNKKENGYRLKMNKKEYGYR